MTPYYTDASVTLYHGDALAVLRELPDASADCCVTSPPYYGLRDYGEPGQYGLEESPAEYVETMRAVFAEVRRVLDDAGTLWLDLGDSYVSNGGASGRLAATGLEGTHPRTRPEADNPHAFGKWNRDWGGLPVKNLLGIPWRVAFALQDDGWTLRNAVVWSKPNAMPESVTDRLSTRYELVFLLTKARRYWFDLDAVREPHTSPPTPRNRWQNGGGSPESMSGDPTRDHGSMEYNPAGRNPGDVWTIPTQPFPEAHFAVMAPELARRCVVAGCKPGGVVLDPFCGVGTTGMAAGRNGRRFVGIDLSDKTLDLALRTRLAQGVLVEVPDGA